MQVTANLVDLTEYGMHAKVFLSKRVSMMLNYSCVSTACGHLCRLMVCVHSPCVRVPYEYVVVGVMQQCTWCMCISKCMCVAKPVKRVMSRFRQLNN